MLNALDIEANKIVAGLVIVSFACSFALNRLVSPETMSDGMKVIILTVALSAAAAVLFPVPEEKEGGDGA